MPGDLDRLIRSITAGLFRMLSGDSIEEAIDGLRSPRVFSGAIDPVAPFTGDRGASILPSILDVSSLLDLGGSFPSRRSYKLSTDSALLK